MNDVLTWLDVADLVIVNLTPLEGPAGKSPSSNAYYELGLVHALGLPVILLAQEGTDVPFYFRTSRYYEVADFTVPVLVEALRNPIQRFLVPANSNSFSDNRVTQFYGLPIVDISAAVGLATGYYHNFVGRLLRDGSFVTAYPAKVRHLIVVRPPDVLHTYRQDHDLLIATLVRAGFTLQKEQLSAPAGDENGDAWIEHVDGVVIDLPRTIYPLKSSPRLLALRERMDKSDGSSVSEQHQEQMLRQHGTNLVQRIERIIRYHVRREREGYRGQLLEFANLDEMPTILRRLGIAPTSGAGNE